MTGDMRLGLIRRLTVFIEASDGSRVGRWPITNLLRDVRTYLQQEQDATPAAPTSKQRVSFNINEAVWVQLRDRGRAELRRQHDELRRSFPKLDPYREPAEDENGWSRWQLWALMEELGPLCQMGFDPPFATEIQFELPQQDSDPRDSPPECAESCTPRNSPPK